MTQNPWHGAQPGSSLSVCPLCIKPAPDFCGKKAFLGHQFPTESVTGSSEATEMSLCKEVALRTGEGPLCTRGTDFSKDSCSSSERGCSFHPVFVNECRENLFQTLLGSPCQDAVESSVIR